VPSGWAGDIVETKVRPIEPRAQRCEWSGYQSLVYFDDVEDRVGCVNLLEAVHDVADRWLGPAKVELRLGTQSVGPRRCEEAHDPVACREAVLVKQRTVVAMHQADPGAE